MLWLAALYPLCHGPVVYFVARGSLPIAAMRPYRPVGRLMLASARDSESATAAVAETYRRYLEWWRVSGERRAPPPPPAPVTPWPTGRSPQ